MRSFVGSLSIGSMGLMGVLCGCGSQPPQHVEVKAVPKPATVAAAPIGASGDTAGMDADNEAETAFVSSVKKFTSFWGKTKQQTVMAFGPPDETSGPPGDIMGVRMQPSPYTFYTYSHLDGCAVTFWFYKGGCNAMEITVLGTDINTPDTAQNCTAKTLPVWKVLSNQAQPSTVGVQPATVTRYDPRHRVAGYMHAKEWMCLTSTFRTGVPLVLYVAGPEAIIYGPQTFNVNTDSYDAKKQVGDFAWQFAVVGAVFIGNLTPRRDDGFVLYDLKKFEKITPTGTVPSPVRDWHFF